MSSKKEKATSKQAANHKIIERLPIHPEVIRTFQEIIRHTMDISKGKILCIIIIVIGMMVSIGRA